MCEKKKLFYTTTKNLIQTQNFTLGRSARVLVIVIDTLPLWVS